MKILDVQGLEFDILILDSTLICTLDSTMETGFHSEISNLFMMMLEDSNM